MITISLCTSFFLFLLDIFAILRKPSLTFFNSDNDIVYFRVSRAIQSFYRRILGLVMVLILSLTNIKLSSEKGQMMSEAFFFAQFFQKT